MINSLKGNAEGVRRSAILLSNLDEDAAADILRNMQPADVALVSTEVARLGNVTHDELKKVLEEFMDDAEQHAAVSVDLRQVLTKALGEDKAAAILDDIQEEQQNVGGIDKLNLMEANTVSEMIRDEHPQIIATILVHLERSQAASILEYFEASLRNDVIWRIANFNGVQPIALHELTNVLSNMLDGQNLKRSKMGGVRATAEILNTMKSDQEESAITSIREISEELAQKIQDEMFLFENLIELDNRSIQSILNEVDPGSLAIALKGAAPDLLDKFTGQMSARQAEMFKEDMDSRGPLRMSQVEAEQKNILTTVRRLAASGDIVIGAGDDTYV